MALLGALCVGLNALGFTNRSLRAQVSRSARRTAYTANQMSYDLARLRLNGLIDRRPDTNTYDLTPDGQRVAIFYTKVHDRLLRPLLAADQPPAPTELRTRPGHRRPARPRLHRPRTPGKRRLKTQDQTSESQRPRIASGVARFGLMKCPIDDSVLQMSDRAASRSTTARSAGASGSTAVSSTRSSTGRSAARGLRSRRQPRRPSSSTHRSGTTTSATRRRSARSRSSATSSTSDAAPFVMLHA